MRSLTRAGFLAGLALAVGHPAVAQETETQPANGAEAAPAEAPAETAEAADYDASTVVARVGETEITLGHVVALRSRLPQQYQALPDEALFQGLIDQLIDQELLSRTLSENPEDDPLAVRLHLENERRAALAQRAVLERVEVPVEDADIEEAYDRLVEEFEPQTEYNAAHIIVPTEEEAAELKAEIEGGADFAEVAKEHSQDGAAAQGGSLGWFGAGQMVPEFEEAVVAMEPGEIAGPVQTQFGWHLIKLNEVRETEPPALQEVHDELADQVRQERLNAEVMVLREEGDVERTETGIPPRAVRNDELIED